MNIIKSLFAFLVMLVATLFTASHAQAFALGNHAGGFFLGTLDCTEENNSSTHNLCRKNGWLNYDTLSGCSVATNKADDFVDLASSSRRRHILDGNATGGGHRPGTGIPGKSEFPAGWSDDRIMHNISDIATDPTLRSRLGRGGRTITEGIRDGIDIRVIQERNGDIVTGFPTNVPRNPRP